MSYEAKASAFITLRNAYFNITEFWKFGKNLSSLIKIKPVQCQKKKFLKKRFAAGSCPLSLFSLLRQKATEVSDVKC